LNPAALQRLRRLGDDQFVSSMIGLFFSFVAEKLAEARRCWKGGDLIGVGSAGHAIKSTAANAGAGRVHDLAAQLEKAGNGEDPDRVKILLPQLEEAYVEVKPLLEKEKAKLDAPGDSD
jgi:HPt (histidine-containing phosphotransfer) domain-containing protein